MVVCGRGYPPPQVAVAQAGEGEIQRVEVVYTGAQTIQVAADHVDLGRI